MVDAAISPHPTKTEDRFGKLFADALSGVQDPATRTMFTVAAWAITVAITAIDFLASYEITLRYFYSVPLIIIVAMRGRRAAFLMACACDITWQLGDKLTGAQYSSAFIPAWNLLIALANYSLVIFMFAELIDLKRELEGRVRSRTAALLSENAARRELEREVISVAERERLSIGYELHDGLSQHFTATAIATQVLARRLEKEGHNAVADARQLVKLIEDGINQTRRLAKGLLLFTVESDGLARALKDLAKSTADHSDMRCDTQIDEALGVNDVVVATHIFRIAEEAVRNAARHSKASQLQLTLVDEGGGVTLVVKDNGVGLPGDKGRERGMGLKIMAHRAATIGADFAVTNSPNGGVQVVCRWHRAEDIQ